MDGLSALRKSRMEELLFIELLKIGFLQIQFNM